MRTTSGGEVHRRRIRRRSTSKSCLKKRPSRRNDSARWDCGDDRAVHRLKRPSDLVVYFDRMEGRPDSAPSSSLVTQSGSPQTGSVNVARRHGFGAVLRRLCLDLASISAQKLDSPGNGRSDFNGGNARFSLLTTRANNDATSSLVMLAFSIRPVTVSTTQSSRGPPAVVHLAISHRKFRHAA